jgi:16S rRNA (uracil1498-N3)-methyltransferase
MELYFTESDNIKSDYAVFDDFEARHILKTMRKKSGDLIQFTDGKGRLFQGIISTTHPALRVNFELLEEYSWPVNIQSALGIGFIRPARMDFMIEKATELGITHFFLFSGKHSNYRTNNTTRWEKISRQAMKQSNRLFLPEIKILADLKSVVEETKSINFKYMAEQSSTRSIFDLLIKKNEIKSENILFLIGPEGGFDKEEIKHCTQSGFHILNFGESRLRAETAAIAAASYLNLIRN